METTRRIRILLVDDHPVVRSGIAALLGSEGDMEVVGEAETLAQGRVLFADSAPDVVLVDLMLPDGSGVDLVKELRRSGTTARFIVLTARTAVGDLDRAKAAGVHGYLFKSARRNELLSAIRAVALGGQYVSPAVEQESSQARAGTDLTPRELDVLRRIARGLANHQIARDLGIGEETVRSHSKNILQKLGVSSRSEAAEKCWQLGLME